MKDFCVVHVVQFCLQIYKFVHRHINQLALINDVNGDSKDSESGILQPMNSSEWYSSFALVFSIFYIIIALLQVVCGIVGQRE